MAEAREAVVTLRGGRALLADRSPEAPPAGSTTGGDALRDWMASAGHVLLAGTLDGAVVGMAAGHVRRLAEERVGTIDSLYVEPDARGVGVGSALTEAIVAAFAELRCTAVDAPALPGDRASKQRFEAAGFSARLLTLHRPLP